MALTRIKILSFFIVIFSFLLLGKLFFVQVLESSAYSERADRQYATPAENIFQRGSIFFREKSGTLISAAGVLSGFKAAIRPAEIEDPEQTYQKLVEIVPLKHESFLERAAKKDDPYEEIINRLTKEEADKLEKLNLPGVYIFKEKWRFYPGGDLAARTVGFIAYNGDELSGRYGLEKSYNEILTQEDKGLYVNFFAEIFSNLGKIIFKGAKKEGDVITTLEPTVQSFLENQLQSVIEEWKPDSAAGIVLDPKTGAIYALAALPGFNLNNFNQVEDVSLFSNPVVESVFEFGSIIKPLVMAAALDQGVVTAETTYYDAGSVAVEGKIIHNFDKKGRGTVNMQEVINQSLNTGMVFVTQKIGKENLKNYLLAYGIGEKTGVDLPGEVQGLVSNLASSREIEFATASFGQGIAFTPIAAARAFSVLANSGLKVRPYLVSEIRFRQGDNKKIEPLVDENQVIKPETAEEITRMMVKVVDEALFSGNLKLSHYSVAAKTGTAQIAEEDGRGYYEDRFLHSFFGYFPAYDPRFLVLLYAIDPKGVRFSSQTLAPPFMEIAKFLLNYYQVPPDR